MVSYKPPIVFVKSTEVSGARPQYRKVIAPIVTQFVRVQRNRVKANTTKRVSIEPKEKVRLILSLVRSPVMNGSHIIDEQGAAKRALQGKPIFYRVYVHAKGFLTHVDINLFKLMVTYGPNIGFLRSQIRTHVLRTRDFKTFMRPTVKRCPSVFAKHAANLKLITSLQATPNSEVRMPAPHTDLFHAPKGHGIYTSIFGEASINAFMLFKFFFPEVFIEIEFPLDNSFTIAMLGYYARKDTIFERSEDEVKLKMRDRVNRLREVAEWFYCEGITRCAGLLRPPRNYFTRAVHPPRLPMGSYAWPDPRYAIARYFRYTDYVRRVMNEHPKMQQIWAEVDAENAASKVHYLPSMKQLAATVYCAKLDIDWNDTFANRPVQGSGEILLAPYLQRRFDEVFKRSCTA